MWFETDKKELILGQLLCLEGSDKKPKLGKCHEMGGNQEWHNKGAVIALNLYIIIVIFDLKRLIHQRNVFSIT